MRIRLAVGAHSLPFEVCIKIFTLHAKLSAVTHLEASKVPSTHYAANCPLRDLECLRNLPKREELQLNLLAIYGYFCPSLSNNIADMR